MPRLKRRVSVHLAPADRHRFLADTHRWAQAGDLRVRVHGDVVRVLWGV